MTKERLLELATWIARDLKEWSEEATHRQAIEPDELDRLYAAAEIVDRVTVAMVAAAPEA